VFLSDPHLRTQLRDAVAARSARTNVVFVEPAVAEAVSADSYVEAFERIHAAHG
jgi:hypothetical protein